MWPWEADAMFHVIPKHCGFRLILLLGLMLPLRPAATLAQESADPAPHVLILNSYHRGYNWTDEQSDAMLKFIRAAAPASNQDVVYMDWKRFPFPETLDDLASTLKHRYQNSKIDLILTTDDAALIFALKHRKELLSNAPIVYSGVFESSAKEYTANERNVTGVYEAVDPEGTLRVAMRLNPKYRHVYIIHDSTETSLELEKEIFKALEVVNAGLDAHVLTKLPFEELRAQVTTLPPDSFILLASYARDANGVVMQPERFAQLMSASANAPIYTMYDHMLGIGVVGGSLLSGHLQGEAAAGLGAMILQGVPAKDLAPVSRKTVFFGFEYPQLLRFAIPLDRLPPGSQVFGKPFSFFETYSYWIMSVLAVFCILLLLISLLLISRRKRLFVEVALRESETKLRNIFDQAPVGIIIFDQDSLVIDCNRTMSGLFGVPRERYLGTNYLSVLRDGVQKEGLRQALLSGESTAEGWYTPVSTEKVSYIKAQTKRVADGLYMAILEDLSDRKQAEESLRESEARFKTLVEQAPEAIIVSDALDDRILLVNANAEKLFGCSREELLTLGHHRFYLQSQPDGKPITESIRENRRRAMSGEVVIIERAIRNAHGEELFCEVRLVKFPALDSHQVRASWINITERKRMLEMMIQNEKMISVGGLAAGMAHEINNPLSGILQGAQVLLSRLDADNKGFLQAASTLEIPPETLRAFLQKRNILDMVENIREAATRAARIVSSMLAFSRKSDAAKSSEDVNQLLETAVDLSSTDYSLKKNFDFKRISIVREYAERLPLVSCSSGQIQQVLMNLLGNAAHALASERAPDAPAPQITLRTRLEGDWVCIEVEDNGPGMGEAVRHNIFEPFFTTKPVGQGTGLGLSVSYFIIVNNHGGSIEAVSPPNGGAQFVVRLPVHSKAGRTSLDTPLLNQPGEGSAE